MLLCESFLKDFFFLPIMTRVYYQLCTQKWINLLKKKNCVQISTYLMCRYLISVWKYLISKKFLHRCVGNSLSFSFSWPAKKIPTSTYTLTVNTESDSINNIKQIITSSLYSLKVKNNAQYLKMLSRPKILGSFECLQPANALEMPIIP